MVSGRAIILMSALIPLIVGVTAIMPQQDGDTAPYYVVFDSQGGTPQKTIKIAQEGEVVLLDANAHKFGYVLMGWSLEPNGEPTEYISVTGDTTVYAVWMNEVDQDGYLQSPTHHVNETREYLTPVGYAIKYSPYALVIVTVVICQYLLYTRYQYRGLLTMFEMKSLAILTVIASITICAGVVFLSVDQDNTIQNEGGGGSVGEANVQTWTSGDCTCTLDDNGLFTVSGNGAMANYAEHSPWYSVQEQIKSVVINDGVTVIGSCAFRECKALNTLTIPNSVTTIYSQAFNQCTSLTSVDLGSVTTISYMVFMGCTSLASVTISASVTSIGAQAFFGCSSLVNIFFLSTTWNITSIGSQAFYLGTSFATTVNSTVHSPNNVANGQLDAYKDEYTTFTYVASAQYTINVNPPGYGSVSPTPVQIWEGVSVAIDGNRLVFSDGQTVTANPSPATSQYTYAFDNWTLGNLTQTANFTRTPVPYTVTFQSADTSMGTVSAQSVVLDYGTQISYWDDGGVKIASGETVYCVASPNNGFLFDHWDGVAKTPDTTTVEGDMTLTAYFKPQFYVRATIESNNTDWGSVDSGFVTVSLYNTVSATDNVLTITDRYTNATYNITATPTPSTVQFTYAFDSWSGIPEGGVITEDTTITANFTQTVNTFTVTIQADPEHPTWGSVNVSSFTDVPYGTGIRHENQFLYVGAQSQEATPQPASAPYRYLFNSWSGVPEGGQVVADITVTAIFEQTEEYIITFQSNNAEYGTTDEYEISAQAGSVVSVTGNKITVGGKTVTAVPTPSTPQYLYTFVDWSNTPATITGDVTITANFQQTLQTYMVSFVSNNPSWGTITPPSVVVDYGSIIYVEHNEIRFSTLSITVSANPTQSTARYDYNFTGWSNVPESGLITGATVITANFEQVVHQYTVTVVTDPQDGSYGTVTDKTVKVDAGSRIVADGVNLRVGDAIITTAEPKQSTIQYIYKFDKWTGVPTQEVLEDYTITAVFTRDIQEYTVTFQPADGTRGTVDVDGETILVATSFKVPFGTAIVKDGHIITIGADIHNAVATAKEDYTFIAWHGVPEDGMVKGDVEISAQFETLTIILSADKMYCVSGMEAPWMYNPFTAKLNMEAEGVWSISDPSNTGLTIDKDTGAFGGVIKQTSDFGVATIKVVFTPTQSNKEISATFTLYFEPKLVIVG